MKKYRYKNDTTASYEEVVVTSAPTTCINPAHTFNADSLHIIDEDLYEALRNENYNLKGYQKERAFNSLGDIDTITYWDGYVDVNNKGTKVVEEVRTYARNTTTGLLERRDITHNWYENGSIVATKTTTKYYSAEEGYDANIKAAKNLTRQAAMYLISQIGVANGKLYLDTVVTEMSAYESGSRAMLLADIAGTDFTTYGATDATHSATIKATMDAILNVSYT